MRGVEQVPWLYDALCSLLEFTGLRRWRGWLVAQARGTVLEVGCGTGRNLPLYPAGQAPIALEIDAAMIAAARRRAPGVLFVRASAEALPFRDGAFDTVLSSLVFCSVPDVPRGLAEVHRVLAVDGALCMLEHVRHRHGLAGLAAGPPDADLEVGGRGLRAQPRHRGRRDPGGLHPGGRLPARAGHHAALPGR